jgi:pilus assembly protein FimV
VRTINVAILAGILALAEPLAAQAAGLGRLTVLSPLGSPLNAEIEIVSLQPGEEDGLSARLASVEAYRQAGIEPSSALRTVRFAIVKRDGRPVLRVTSSAPVNEPFMDLLVDLEWTSGRLTREYTVLLDPPELRGPQAIAAAPQKPAVPSAQPLPPLEAKPKPQAAAPAQDSGAPVQDSGAPVQDSSAAAQDSGAPVQDVAAPAQGRGAPVQDVPAKPERVAGANTYDVKRGDTLGEIARANLPQGVNLNQMMIAIYRANPDAFLRENINLVRAGRTLNMPSADELSGVSAAEANQLVQAHRTEWEDYRSRLAAAPTRAETASGRAVTGKIEGKPEAGAPGAAEEQVRLSKADPAKPGAAAAARADDAAARERALKEAQSRVTDLEKNVADLQKLLELKNQQLAELEKKSGSKPAAKAEPAKPEPAKPAAAPLAQAPAPGASAPAPGASTQVGAAPAPEAKKAEAPAPEAKKAEPSPEAKKAEPAKPKAKAAPPPPPAPSLLDEFLDNTVALAGLGAVVVLLLGYALWSWRRKKANQAKFSDSVLGPGGGTGPSLGDSRSGVSASQASVSQTSGMEAEEVDPIAEADVYMAYGRDAQAEEILKEALQKDSNRIPVHAKLLEIYAKRNDTRAFEQSALRLKTLTNGGGADWDKAAALGRSIDPGNGLYGGGSSAGTMAAAPAAAAFAGAAAAAPSIDFDIGGATSSGMVTTDIPLDQPRTATPSTIDFDLGASSTPNSVKVPDPDATLAAIDFNLDAEPTKKPAPASAPAPAAVESASTASGLDFDLNLDLGDQSASATKSIPSMDLSSISLDLGSAGEPGSSTSSNDPKWQEVATKLDLAKAYEEMGDKDGARELLGEVMKDGDATQKGQAQQLLSKLG